MSRYRLPLALVVTVVTGVGLLLSSARSTTLSQAQTPFQQLSRIGNLQVNCGWPPKPQDIVNLDHSLSLSQVSPGMQYFDTYSFQGVPGHVDLNSFGAQALIAVYTVPSGKSLVVTDVYVDIPAPAASTITSVRLGPLLLEESQSYGFFLPDLGDYGHIHFALLSAATNLAAPSNALTVGRYSSSVGVVFPPGSVVGLEIPTPSIGDTIAYHVTGYLSTQP